jgi:signal transduction histidine kinase
MPYRNTLRFSPEILQRLGEELIPHVDQGIIELVRNAYDADAVNCSVELVDIESPGGKLRVTDDGIGMELAQIRNGWLILGRSSKAGRQPTKKFNRMPVGDKGLGRLAALRLGSKAILTTRPEKEPSTEYRVVLDWKKYESADTVESIDIKIEKLFRKRTKSSGTTIEIVDLSVQFGKQDIKRLARSLIMLADPFRSSQGFSPKLIVPGYKDVAERVNNSYLDDADYRLEARLGENGEAEAIAFDKRGKKLFVAGQKDFKPPYKTTAVEFTLWSFLLNKPHFSLHTAKIRDLREWLSEVGGVHLYHRCLRVHPYGEPGHDWLDMNLRRAQSPEERPSTNNSIGRLIVDDPNEILLQKTDRVGFVENDAFQELKRFAKDALEWMARKRLAMSEERRQKDRMNAADEITSAKKHINEIIGKLPTNTKMKVTDAFKKFEMARQRESRSIREDLHLYRTLATVGTTTAIFAHESAQPVRRIETAVEEVKQHTNEQTGLFDRTTVRKLADIIGKCAKSLNSFANFTVNFLKRDKRRSGLVDVHATINELTDLFRPFLENSRIKITLQLVGNSNPSIFGSIASLESIIANLITNASYALIYAKPKQTDSLIVIQTTISGDRLIMRVLDNGPGIVGLDLNDIWLPGRTTKPGGTGLGLTIVRDTVSDLGGTVNVISPGEFGGAEFSILLPIRGESK